MLHPLGKVPFGKITFPYVSFGNIDSMDLFGINETVIFDFYNRNRNTYKNVLDLGANIGLHSLIMSRCGWNVKAWEPDPIHAAWFGKVMVMNDCSVELHEAAASWYDNKATNFVRVKGNTTGSHIKGSKPDPYGDIETFKVKVENIEPYAAKADFMKIDIEGHEAELIENLPIDIWNKCDAIVEVGSKENAERIFNKLRGRLFSQKTNWRKVQSLYDTPRHHSEGSLFITSKNEIPCG